MTTQAGTAERKDLVPYLEFPNVHADGFNVSGQLAPQNRPPWSRDSKRQTCDGSKAGRHVKASHPPISRRYRRRTNSDPDFIVLWGGRCQILERQNFGRSVSLIHDGFQSVSSMGRSNPRTLDGPGATRSRASAIPKMTSHSGRTRLFTSAIGPTALVAFQNIAIKPIPAVTIPPIPSHRDRSGERSIA